MKQKIFTGAAVAIVTPFKGENFDEVDYDALGDLIEFQIDNGTDAIVICGTTGEASTMPDSEHLSVIEYAVRKTAGKIPVIAGTGSNDTKHAISLSRQAESLGADALLSVTPYYNKTTQDGLYEHFKAIAQSVSLPIILYNVPSRTNLNIEPATFERLCKIPNINAVKECNLLQIPETVKRCGDELNFYSGEDGYVHFLMSAGGLGVISVVSNIAPRYMSDMVKAYLNGEIEKSWKMQVACQDLVKALFCEVNPIPVKEALNLIGLRAGGCRLPLVGMKPENRENQMINIAINGCNGKMGQVVAETIAASFSDSARVSYGVDLSAPQNTPFPVYTAFPQIPEAVRADVMIDFSNPAALPGLLNFARSRRIPVVIATTGLSNCLLYTSPSPRDCS